MTTIQVMLIRRAAVHRVGLPSRRRGRVGCGIITISRSFRRHLSEQGRSNSNETRGVR